MRWFCEEALQSVSLATKLQVSAPLFGEELAHGIFHGKAEIAKGKMATPPLLYITLNLLRKGDCTIPVFMQFST